MAISACCPLVHPLTAVSGLHFVATHAPGPGEVISAIRDKIPPTKNKFTAASTGGSAIDVSFYAKFIDDIISAV